MDTDLNTITELKQQLSAARQEATEARRELLALRLRLREALGPLTTGDAAASVAENAELVSSKVMDFIGDGQILMAIKQVRIERNLPLAEAKAIVGLLRGERVYYKGEKIA